jgi:hypothetical protein
MTERVGVIESVDSDNKIVKFLGYGEYLGEEPMNEGTADLGFDGLTIDVPVIKLDSGDTVYGSDVAFWSSQESMEESIVDYLNRGFQVNLTTG